MQALQELNLRDAKELKSLPDEIGNLGSLIKLKIRNSGIESVPPPVKYAVACNIFRNRAAKAPLDTRSMTMGLPLLLGNATHAFRPFECNDEIPALKEPDAIHCILAHFRGIFVEAIACGRGL